MELGLVGPPVPPRRPHPGQCSLEDIGPTQTMRQFASEVMGSREAATGFHTPRSSGAGGNPSVKIPLGREGEGRPEEGPVIISQAAATTVSSEDDQRELVPVEASRIERLESLLLEVVEENKSLKRRLQTESNSSWEIGVTLRMIILRSWISRFHPRHSWSFRGSLKFV